MGTQLRVQVMELLREVGCKVKSAPEGALTASLLSVAQRTGTLGDALPSLQRRRARSRT
jgi:hypothetical protein